MEQIKEIAELVSSVDFDGTWAVGLMLAIDSVLRFTKTKKAYTIITVIEALAGALSDLFYALGDFTKGVKKLLSNISKTSDKVLGQRVEKTNAAPKKK